jgi:hypothetical protein
LALRPQSTRCSGSRCELACNWSVGWFAGGCSCAWVCRVVLHTYDSQPVGGVVQVGVGVTGYADRCSCARGHWCTAAGPGGNILKSFRRLPDKWLKTRPLYGLACLICAEFARQRFQRARPDTCDTRNGLLGNDFHCKTFWQ